MTAVTKSQEGLRYIAWSLLLYLIYLAFFLVVSITHIVGFTTAFIPAFIPIIAMLALFGFLPGASVILFIKGFFALYSHSHGLGPKHEKNMGRSLLLFIGTVVALITLYIVVFASPFFVVFPSAIVVQQGLGVFATFLIGLLLYFMLAALITTELQSRLKLAVVLLVLGSAAAFVTFTVGYLTGGPLVLAFEDNGYFISHPLNILSPLSIQYKDVLGGLLSGSGGLLSGSLQMAATFLFWRIYQASHEAV